MSVEQITSGLSGLQDKQGLSGLFEMDTSNSQLEYSSRVCQHTSLVVELSVGRVFL